MTIDLWLAAITAHELRVAVAVPRYLNGRAATIYAGSNEIQRDLIARQILG